MAGVVAIGESVSVRGYALAGVHVSVAEDAAAVRRAWADLPPDTAVVILTAAAAAVLDPPPTGSEPLTVVLP